MIISAEQVRLAAAYISGHATSVDAPTSAAPVDDALVARVRQAVDGLPDTREDRIASARESLTGPGISSGEVADKLIGRVISDSLR